MHELTSQRPVHHHQGCPSEPDALLQAVARDVQHLLAFVGLNMQGMRKILKKVTLRHLTGNLPTYPMCTCFHTSSGKRSPQSSRGRSHGMAVPVLSDRSSIGPTVGQQGNLAGLRVVNLHAAWHPELSACQLPLPLLPPTF